MRGDRLTLLQILLLTAYAGGMSAGQLLFKMAANSYGTANVGTGERLLALFCNIQRLCCTPALHFYGCGFLVHTFVSSLSIHRVGIRAHTFACRFAVWRRNDFAAPDHRPALSTRRSVFFIGLMEL